MKLSACLFVTASIALAPLCSFAANWWEEMDYGRFLSASFNDTDNKTTLTGAERIATNKGIGVKLGHDGNAGFIFDTELLRATGAWTGGWLKLKGVVFDGGHGPNPSAPANAQIYFGTHVNTPGWSKGDSFQDPRPLPKGPRKADVKPGDPFFADVPFGPLPREWAKYRGLYLSGDRVVFAYTVGEASLLESDDLETAGDEALITRTFNVTAPGTASSLLVADAPEGVTPSIEGDHAVFCNDAKNADDRTVVRVIGAPADAKLVVDGTRVTLKLPPFAAGQKFKVAFAHGTAADLAKLTDAVKAAAQPADLQPLTHGGAPHWTETVKTKGTLGTSEGGFPYVVDNVSAPLDNPYKSKIRIAGLDFFKDGRIAFSTWSGDVWIGKGIDDKLENIEWKRYATGIFHALGLRIVDDQIYVLGRDQITRLHDLNNDGEADFYENFNNDVQVTPGFHEFTFGLETDSKGNFYFIKGGPVNPGGRGWGPLSDHNGCMFKVSGNGQKFEVFATGVRAPNGIGVGPNDEITTGDNQGTWVPVDYIQYVKQGDFIEVPDLSHRVPVPTAYAPHLCWVPYDWDNSNGDQVWVTSDKWGPLKGSMLYLSYGKSSLFGVLQESIGDVRQGGVFKFPLKFETGICRARFNPADGQLYVAGLKGWQTNAAKDGAIERVRYTGKPVTVENELHITDKGITIRFTNEVETSSASDAGNYAIEQYNYRWTSAYGSAEYKVSAPEQKGHDKLEIKSVTVAPDKKSVFLEVPGLQPVMQMKIKMNIKAADGTAIPEGIGNTINVVPPDAQRGSNFTSSR
ncbi:putative large, multifunctional secreted protein [Chthoniobacter flavus Ellin428]|uniref:Putative large, multifunctional secreted protein n=1 Tax=Chthoniobacter flavus Ellin428 TaxID=497964 RepID=B4DA04_9BACT|nr:DUF6797 domain-containing protein [Chthoniobacter flavus]EDY16758.1 putative large, multifunctional secreted protein [Chthoniobacter flavus Ellin428]TCO86719.1 hypothetical protein EV701_12724 [Chthoniobacter flavus]